MNICRRIRTSSFEGWGFGGYEAVAVIEGQMIREWTCFAAFELCGDPMIDLKTLINRFSFISLEQAS